MRVWKRLEVIGVDAVANTERNESEREQEDVYVCVSGVGDGRYGPGAATAASEASPFFLQAFLPPPRFSPLRNPLPCPRRPPSSQFPLILCLRLSPFLCEFFSLSSSLSFPISLLPSSLSFLALAVLVTLSQSIQPDLPSHPPILHPRNAFQPPLTPPPPRCNLPLSPGPLPPSIPSASPLLHRGATLTPPATAQTPPNRATPGLIKEQRGSGVRGSLPVRSSLFRSLISPGHVTLSFLASSASSFFFSWSSSVGFYRARSFIQVDHVDVLTSREATRLDGYAARRWRPSSSSSSFRRSFVS